jgi:hypothetical protein
MSRDVQSSLYKVQLKPPEEDPILSNSSSQKENHPAVKLRGHLPTAAVEETLQESEAISPKRLPKFQG